ncbi:MarR family transcriptional regulator [Cryobacterium sp. PH31-O1]|uniref:MarR family winged helix-turn-helix transcriptional regulator n=1 Tax=Cryobacterium sp. PH31-O1 TaxID=3046306 RepID=UPI0024BB2D35|nr:MarR family transcriptional regulator [Cryobacterium sp. PH31-O1]MDJ0339048.1 MarR family transcriptional regulator [Cryobacterium sp. PH31-O1]
MHHIDHIVEQWRVERPDLDPSPMAVIGRLSRESAHVDARLAAIFGAHGIDAPTFDVLATLARQGPPYRVTPAELAANSMITTSAVAQRLNRLDSLGLVTREPNPDDGRGKFVRLTRSGRELIDKVLPDHICTEEDILKPLSQAERSALAQLLTRITQPD